MVLYGGDEVSAVVFDFGSRSARVGFAGEDCPRSVCPSYTAADLTQMSDDDSSTRKLLGEHIMFKYRPNMQVKRIFSEGLDWQGLEELWDYSYKTSLHADSTEHPLMMTECTWNPKENREKLVEMAFEKFNVPAFYLAKDAILTAFAAGKSTALVLSSGADTTSVVPVYDGYILQKGIQKQSLAGDFLSDQTVAYLEQRKVDIIPQYQVKRKEAVDAETPPSCLLNETPDTHPSFHEYARNAVAHDFKNTVCHTLDVPFDQNSIHGKPSKLYEFPSGYNSLFKAERYVIPEMMFNPKFIYRGEGKVIPQPANGVQHLIHASVQSCDADIRALMYQNIVVSGGNTMFPGFNERLQYELSYMASGQRVKIHVPQTLQEKAYSSWIGGSILASLGTFHQLWISKQEYDEIGPNVVESR